MLPTIRMTLEWSSMVADGRQCTDRNIVDMQLNEKEMNLYFFVSFNPSDAQTHKQS